MRIELDEIDLARNVLNKINKPLCVLHAAENKHEVIHEVPAK